MATLNKVMLIGRLTDNPEAPRAMPSGGMVIKFRFAVGRSKKNPQTGQWENDPNPLYIDCEAFSRPDARRDLVNLIQQYCKKGDSLYLDGRLVLDQWEDKNGGGKRSKHKVVVDNIEFLGGKGGGDEGGEQAGGQRSYGGNAGGGSRAVTSGGGRPAPTGGRGGYSAPDDGDDEFGGGSPPPPPRGGTGNGRGAPPPPADNPDDIPF